MGPLTSECCQVPTLLPSEVPAMWSTPSLLRMKQSFHCSWCHLLQRNGCHGPANQTGWMFPGVSRTTQFPEIGEKEWTYNRMLETSLRDKGVAGRVVSLRLRALPEGVHVMKYLPMTPLYAEETMFQVRCCKRSRAVPPASLVATCTGGLKLPKSSLAPIPLIFRRSQCQP